MKSFFSFLLVVTFALSSFAQNQHIVDSLETLLKNHNALKLEMGQQLPLLYDTTAAEILERLFQAYQDSNPDKAFEYAKRCLTLSEQIGYKKGMNKANVSLAVIYLIQGDYLAAMEHGKKALKFGEEIDDMQGIASAYNIIGNIYVRLGNYPEALNFYFSSLKIRKKIGDKKGAGVSYHNIGTVYAMQKNNFPEALNNLFASLKINKEIGDKKGVAYCYSNIGNIYGGSEGNYQEALKNYTESLKISKEIGDKRGSANTLRNIARCYVEQNKYSEALKFFSLSLEITEQTGDKKGTAFSYLGMGYVFVQQKKYTTADEYLNKALSVLKGIGSLSGIQESYEVLAKLDSAKGDFKQALVNYKLSIVYRDSIGNAETIKKTVELQMNYDFDKKQDSLNIVQANKDIIIQKELQKQKMVRNGFISGFGVVFIFAGVFFRQRKKISKEKQISDNERKRSDDLLLNILPAAVAEEIKTTGTAKTQSFKMVSVMFTDFKDFTIISEKVSPELLVEEIHICFSAFDQILQKYKIEKIKTIGDAYLCASGLPMPTDTHAVDILNAAFEIRNFMLQRKEEKEAIGEIPFEIRIGIHSGPLVAGIVGVKKYAYDIWGDTVNLAARMEQNSEVGKVNISEFTYELVKDAFICTHRGKIEAKNKGEVDMYFVEQNA